MRIIGILVLSFFVANTYSAEHKKLDMSFYEREIPLLGNVVREMAKGPKGYFWIATTTGLIRFDGDRSTYIYGAPGEVLHGVDIHQLFLDEEKLWLGFPKGGVAKLDINTYDFTMYPVDKPPSLGLVAGYVADITKDSVGRIWVLTTKGASRYIDESDSFVTAFNSPTEEGNPSKKGFRKLAVDDLGNHWLVTIDREIKIWNEKSLRFREVHDIYPLLDDAVIREMLDTKNLKYDVKRSPKGDIVLLTGKSLINFGRNGIVKNHIHFQKSVLGFVPKILGLHFGNEEVYIRTRDSNLIIVSSDYETVNYITDEHSKKIGRSSYYQVDMQVDGKGNLAVGHFLSYSKFYNAINRYSHVINVPDFEEDFDSAKITAGFKHGSEYLLFGYPGRFIVLDENLRYKKSIIINETPLSGKFGWDYLWYINENFELIAYDVENNKILRKIKKRSHEVKWAAEGRLWVVTTAGVFSLSSLNSEPKYYLLDDAVSFYTGALRVTKSGDVFLTDSGRIFHYDSKNDNFYRVNYLDGSSVDTMDKRIKIIDGMLFSYGKKIVKYKVNRLGSRVSLSPGSDLKNYRTNEASQTNINDFGIWSQDKTNGILSNYDFLSKMSSNFRVSDGFPSGRGSRLIFVDGRRRLVFAQESELVYYDIPDHFFKQEEPIKIHEVIVANSQQKERLLLNLTEGVVLSPTENTITINYGDFKKHSDITSSSEYRLLGLYDNWVSTTSNSATFSGLNPGIYRFELRKPKDDNKSKFLNIRIIAPWWRTMWAYGFYSLVGMLISSALIYMRWDKVRQARESRRLLKRAATIDTLTGLPNRYSLVKSIKQRVKQCHDPDVCFVALLMDIDRFKNINDSLGHAFGDQLLKHIANRLSSCLEAEEYIARIGGDEFVILSKSSLSTENSVELANRILRCCEKEFIIEEKTLFISLSVGISIGASKISSVGDLLKTADQAMYAAKAKGGNRFLAYDPVMDKCSIENLKLESALRAAIEQDEFKAYFQPKINMHTAKLCGFEALVRWHSVAEGIVPPDRFIGAAETTGLIIKVGAIVLKKTCEQLVVWRDRDLTLVPIAVNISPQQLMQADFVEEVANILHQYNIPPELIELEITEGMVMENMDACILRLNTLRQRGHKISVDDFGTGYSSLSYIKDLPIDILKIDRSFITGVIHDRGLQGIVRTIMNLASNLNLKTVAEGIEDQKTHQYLGDIGCSMGQGFLYAKPLHPDSTELESLICHQSQALVKRYEVEPESVNLEY